MTACQFWTHSYRFLPKQTACKIIANINSLGINLKENFPCPVINEFKDKNPAEKGKLPAEDASTNLVKDNKIEQILQQKQWAGPKTATILYQKRIYHILLKLKLIAKNIVILKERRTFNRMRRWCLLPKKRLLF